VDRLVESPTQDHLYNAACALAVFSEMTHDPRPLPHALALLGRAIKAGFPRPKAAADPDLKPLHGLPGFGNLLAPDGTR
jgi:hypothetical protein